jgi:hypothetical protein
MVDEDEEFGEVRGLDGAAECPEGKSTRVSSGDDDIIPTVMFFSTETMKIRILFKSITN